MPHNNPLNALRLGVVIIIAAGSVAACTGESAAKCAKEVHVLVSTPMDGYSQNDCPMLRAEAVLHVEVLPDGHAGQIRVVVSEIDAGAEGPCKNPKANVEAMAHHVFDMARFVAPGKRCEKLISFNVGA